MLFLNVEDLSSKRLQSHISQLVAAQQQVSFFLDEAHLLVLEEDFRHLLRYIPDIIRFRQQIIFISATLPSCLLNVLESKFSLVQNHIIRGSTTRRNVIYRTQVVELGQDRLQVLVELYSQL
jgi:superfamily II DNA helicase RecQ